jgi:hypothetical protein
MTKNEQIRSLLAPAASPFRESPPATSSADLQLPGCQSWLAPIRYLSLFGETEFAGA